MSLNLYHKLVYTYFIALIECSHTYCHFEVEGPDTVVKVWPEAHLLSPCGIL